MEQYDPTSATFKLLMQRLDRLEKNMIDKSDVVSSVLMAHAFAILTLTGIVVVIEVLVGFG